jgi:hypothetical protein
MTGRHSGAVTRFAEGTLPGFYRIWCAAHQLDLVIQSVISSRCEDTFYETLTGLISHLRRQQRLVAETKSTCPAVASTRWLSLGRVVKWLSKHSEAVIRHFDVTSKEFYTDRSRVRDLFADLSHFALSRFTALVDEDKQRLESAFGKLFLNAREGINAIGAESDSDNSISQEKLPPVLPRDLRSLPPGEFNSIVLKQARRLARSGREELCTDLEREFKQFKCAIHDDTALREEHEI